MAKDVGKKEREGGISMEKELFIHYHHKPNNDHNITNSNSIESLLNQRKQQIQPPPPHHHRHFVRQRSLSQYAVTLPQQPTDVSVVQTKDDNFCFFAKGRDFQPHSKQHKYTAEELRILETYEGSSRLPSNSQIYREWTNKQPFNSLQKAGWGIVTLIALLTGLLAFGMKEICEKLQIFYNPFIKDYIDRGQPYRLLMYHAGISCACVSMASIICVYSCPWASGSGIPEIICILNGTVVRNVLTLKTLVCKTISISFAVLSGLPIGYEGPMVHIGAIIGALLSKPPSRKCPCRPRRICNSENNTGSTSNLPDQQQQSHKVSAAKNKNHKTHPCCRYRDCEERHSLICLGAACGIASAFSAPISALLFVIEEISTDWSTLLTWKAFVCCIVARSVTEALRSLISSIEHYDSFFIGFLELSESAIFDVKDVLTLNSLIVIPTLLLGIAGGLLGSFYIFLHLKMAKVRRRLMGAIKCKEVLSVVKVLEPVTLALISSLIIMATLPYFSCKPLNYEGRQLGIAGTEEEGRNVMFHAFRCNKPLVTKFDKKKIIQTGEYSEAATLLFGSWDQMVRNLLSRKTPNKFSIPVLTIILLFFFFISSWSALTSIASGLLIPQLAIGALYGRMLGVATYKIADNYVDFNSTNPSVMEKWEWIDPGAFALLGAASFMAGTTRLPVTTVIMMIEMTNDASMCLLIMIVVMVSKAIGDYFTHPLYHSLIEFKCIPFLELDLDIVYNKKKLNLDLFKVSDFMSKRVHFINVQESVQVLANLLLDTNHGGFPVVKGGKGVGLSLTFLGTITRMELTILLTKTATFNADELQRECRERIRLSYPDYSMTKIRDTLTTNMILNNYASDDRYQNITVNLMPYVNISAYSVLMSMSLLRSYTLFRSLGLRHLVIVDHLNQVVGIVTRKDLMGFAVISKLKQLLKNNQDKINNNGNQSVDGLL